ncbi:MAG: hypothetical protein GQ526_12265, partial [Ardenticatenales bacterium]|nr:hypothetical protein [Ardenticatenales bacterium]
NVYSARVFEPDKLTLLRSIALVMIVAWLVKVVDGQEWKSRKSQESVWRVPMALPVAVLAAVYLVTTAFSITPRVSLMGSYQRLQGTYTTLSYLVVFGMILVHLRSKAQVNRLVTTAIIVSVPISLYGLVQKYGLDPLPRGGDVTTRIASNMGNAIFVSAYIIMVTPLTLGRIVESFVSILTDEELSWADVIRASIYIFVAAIHGLTILFSQSRGPLLGFLAGMFIFTLILLVRLRDSAGSGQRLKAKELLVALGSLLLIDLVGFGLLYLVGLVATNQGWISIDSSSLPAETFRAALLGALGFIGAVVGGIAGLFVLAAARRGWRWLWLGLILQAALVGGFLVVFNLPNSPISDWRRLPYIGRIGTALDLGANTAKVRTYIWQGAVEMIAPHEPLEFPGGKRDAFNSIRPLVGYGPESMYVAYNRFYPPDLAHVEKRNASPDRSHNETFDALVITGALGFLAWQVVYGSLFFLSFRWLGVIRNRMDQVWFFSLMLGTGAISAIFFWRWLGIEYVGVAFPFGELAGILAYLAYYALFSKPAEQTIANPHSILLTALLAAMVAHFAEIHFGIAIAATRTYFFAYAALAVVLGYVLPRAAAQEQHDASMQSGQTVQQRETGRKQRTRHRSRSGRTIGTRQSTGWVRPILVGGMIMGLLLGTLGYEFITNPPRSDAGEIPGTGQILWSSLTENPQKDFASTFTTLGMFSLTLMIGGALVVSEASKEDSRTREEWIELKRLGLYLVTAVSVGFFYMAFQAGRLRFLAMGAGAQPEQSVLERVRIAADATAGLLAAYYVFVFLALLGIGLVLMNGRQSSHRPSSGAALLTLAAGIAIAVVLINTTNLNVIRADTVYKQADPWDKRASRERNPAIWELAIAEYNHALEFAPLEDFYYLWLGRAYLEQSSMLDDPVAQQQLMEVAKDRLLRARQISPLNTDHSANLARLHTRWAELASSDVERATKANQANEYYEDAHSLSPNNAVILNEWSMLLASLFNDCTGGLDRLEESLALDDQFPTTYHNIGTIAVICGDRARDDRDQQLVYYQRAEDAFGTLLEMQRCNLQAHTSLGYTQSQLGKLEQAIETNLDGLGCVANPISPSTLQFHRNLAILYQQQGDLESAIIHARGAAQAAGDNVSSLLDSGRILLSLGAIEDAHEVAQRAGALDIQSWSQLRDLAVMFSQTGYPTEGIPFGLQALQLAPEDQKPNIQELVTAMEAQAAP